MTRHEFTCSECGRTLVYESEFTTGYGRNADNEKVCYQCIAADEYLDLCNPNTTRFVGYLTGDWFCNWPGTLSATVYVAQGSHNLAGVRRDFWIYAIDREGNCHNWHGVQYGNNSDIAHLTRVKSNGGSRVRVLAADYEAV